MINRIAKFIFPVVKWFGRQHLPFTQKRITSREYHNALTVLEHGDTVLSTAYGEFSNLLIAGPAKHAAMYVYKDGKHCVVEAVGSGVIEKDLIDFMLRKDEIWILRPIFTTADEKKHAGDKIQEFIGLPYDYDFSSDNAAYYCSELVCEAYAQSIRGVMPMVPRQRFGSMTITPTDILKAESKFSIVLAI